MWNRGVDEFLKWGNKQLKLECGFILYLHVTWKVFTTTELCKQCLGGWLGRYRCCGRLTSPCVSQPSLSGGWVSRSHRCCCAVSCSAKQKLLKALGPRLGNSFSNCQVRSLDVFSAYGTNKKNKLRYLRQVRKKNDSKTTIKRQRRCMKRQLKRTGTDKTAN